MNLIYRSLFGISLGVLCASFFLEYVQGLAPCPLCLMQRFMVILLTGYALVMLFNTRYRSRGMLLGYFLIATMGLYFSGRQLWLQAHPADLSSCSADLASLLRYFPWKDIAYALFMGSSDCHEMIRFWGLSLPLWSSFYFLGMMLISFGLLSYYFLSSESS
jgi:disulfide bond formation protein DsbB